MEYMEFIKPELLILVPVLYALGALIKNTELVNDKFIPIVLLGVSVVLTCIYVVACEGISSMVIFVAVTQSILCAAAAVFSNQLYKQLSK